MCMCSDYRCDYLNRSNLYPLLFAGKSAVLIIQPYSSEHLVLVSLVNNFPQLIRTCVDPLRNISCYIHNI